MTTATFGPDGRGILRHLRASDVPLTRTAFPLENTEPLVSSGFDVPVTTDLVSAAAARENIRLRPFVTDAHDPEFASVQRWIEKAGADVDLPLNFCGSLLIMRFYRLIAPASEQTPAWMAAIYDAAAAYDFAFLALGHADDEADGTTIRNGYPTRFMVHPETRAVDGINLLLAGVTAMQERLREWPDYSSDGVDLRTRRHPLTVEILEAFARALREASFPILLDRAGTGHTPVETRTSATLGPLIVDASSLRRLEAFSRHRAQTYFMRATELAAHLAGYEAIETDLWAVLDKLFGALGLLGAATDDIQDLFLDFAAGIHSACTVMAQLCVADERSLRPQFRRHLPKEVVRDQATRLSSFFARAAKNSDQRALLDLLDEIELRRALTEYYQRGAADLAKETHKAATAFGFNPQLLVELVATVSQDPEFSVPEMFLTALETPVEEDLQTFITEQAGKFIAEYLVERFWPRLACGSWSPITNI